MRTIRLIMTGLMLSALSMAAAQTLPPQEQAYEIARFRLEQLRSGGIALLPISLTLTLPPGVDVPPLRLQRHLEKSMTEALLKLHKDIKVVPPDTTMRVLQTAPIILTERLSLVVQGDSLLFDEATARLLRKRTDTRFLMSMSLAPTWLSSALRQGAARSAADSLVVVCRIWDTETGKMVWQAQHPWPPAEADTSRARSAMQAFCAKVLAQIPK